MKKLTLLLLCALLSCSGTPPMKIVAHRGYWKADGAVQNSIASLKAAGEIKVYGSEFDVWLTADGRMVVNHDADYNGLEIASSTFDALRQYPLANGEPIPSLEEYLEAAQAYPALHLVLELKSNYQAAYDSAAVAYAWNKVSEYGLADRTTYISFSFEACRLFAKAGGDVQYLGSDRSVDELHAAGITGLDAHHSLYESHPETVSQAHAAGMTVNAWTVNEKADALRLRALGVDMLTTDEPAGMNYLR